MPGSVPTARDRRIRSIHWSPNASASSYFPATSGVKEIFDYGLFQLTVDRRIAVVVQLDVQDVWHFRRIVLSFFQAILGQQSFSRG